MWVCARVPLINCVAYGASRNATDVPTLQESSNALASPNYWTSLPKLHLQSELVTADATAVRQTAVLLAALNASSTFFIFLHFIRLVAQRITFRSSVDISQICQIQTVLLDVMLARSSDDIRRQMAQLAPTVHPQYDSSSSIHLRFYENLSWTSLATE